jgi:hypothetical protein
MRRPAHPMPARRAYGMRGRVYKRRLNPYHLASSNLSYAYRHAPACRHPHAQKELAIEELSLEERIRRRAYELYIERGNESGSELDDGLQAKEEIRNAEEAREARLTVFSCAGRLRSTFSDAESPGCRRRAGFHTKLLKDMLQVLLYGPRTDTEYDGNLAVCFAAADPCQHLALAPCESTSFDIFNRHERLF